ncbi:MAG: hypothetical protein KAI43_11580 [Candidatus Aureabacteria bacterium]|nr:hypothetical protein [Candidatus Auribacterota bacterium]
MSLRVTTGILISQSISDINANLKRLQYLQKQISTGKRIIRPSDDPIGASKSMRFTRDISKTTMYQTNMRDGINRLKATERVMEDILDMILDIQSISAEGAVVNASIEMATISGNIDMYLNVLLQNANAKFQGKFIFGGTETLSGTAPLSAPYNAVYDSNGNITGVIQNIEGIDQLIRYQIAEGIKSEINISGSAPFQPNGSDVTGDIFQTLIDLRDAFNSSDINAVNENINELNDEYETIITQASLIGARIGVLQREQTRQEDLQINLQELLSATVDVDIAEAIIEESYTQYLYQASLQVGAKIIPQSLLDFI